MPELDLEVHEEPAHYIAFDLSGAGKMLTNYAIVLYGWALKNPSGASTAAADIYDNTDGTGTAIIPLTFATSESIGDWFGPGGILLKNGVYVNVTSGEVKGSLFYRRHHH